MFGRGWEPAQATILAVKFNAGPTGSHSSGIRAEFVADVQPESGTPAFRATFKQPFNKANFHRPDVGQFVQVKFDAKSKEVKFDLSDPANRRDAAETREQDEFDAIAKAPPGTPVAPAGAGAEQPAEGGLAAALDEVAAATAEVSAALPRQNASGAFAPKLTAFSALAREHGVHLASQPDFIRQQIISDFQAAGVPVQPDTLG